MRERERESSGGIKIILGGQRFWRGGGCQGCEDQFTA